MIKKLDFKNFKSWNTLTKVQFSKITGFFGTNSSGKSSIIQLLLLLKQTIESTDRNQVFDFGSSSSYTELGSFKEIISNHDVDKSLDINIDIDFLSQIELYIETLKKKDVKLIGKEFTLSASIKQNGGNRVFVDKFQYDFAENKFSLTHVFKDNTESYTGEYELESNQNNSILLQRAKGRPWPLPSPFKFYGFPDQVKSYFTNAGFLSDLQVAFEECFKNVYYLGPLREYPKREYKWTGSQPADMGRRGEDVVYAILSANQLGDKIKTGVKKGTKYYTLEEYVAFWLKELQLIHSFSIKRISNDSNLYRVLVKKSANSSEVLITDVGFGVSQILPIIALCFYVPIGSTLIIEQPEIHLHPSVQSGLADVFIDAMKKRGIQIILESHSEHLLRRLQRRLAENKDFKNDDIQLYFCKPEGGYSCLEKLNIDLFGLINNWPSNFFGDEMNEIAETQKAILKRKVDKK